MTIRIVTDSTCDLPKEIIEENDITVVPLYINVGDESYADGVDMPRAEFYRRLPHFPAHPTTASTSPEIFRRVYERLEVEGATAILSVHIAESLSATVNNARLAAREVKSGLVSVLDSGQFSLALGFAVQKAAALIRDSVPIQGIVEVLKEQLSRASMYAVVDGFEYLRRSGRVSTLAAGVGAVIKIKPILSMHDGKASSITVRTRKRAMEFMVQKLGELAPLERLGFIHTEDPTPAEELKERLKSLLPKGEDILSVSVTPVVGAHVGMGGLGFAAVSARSE